jgi:short-subunit dehydrogenase
MQISKKVYVVTGGGSGIGREIVRTLLSNDASVVAIDINEKALSNLVSDIKSIQLSTYQLDICDKDSVDKFVQTITQKQSIDGIINNVGIIHPFINVEDLTHDQIKRIFDVNVFGTLNLVKSFIPILKSNKESIIVNVSSMGAFVPVSGQTIYGASKAAVKLLTEGLMAELSKTSIRVMVVYPGGVGTNIMENSGVKMSQRMIALRKIIKLTTPEKVAQKIVYGIKHNRKRIPIGIDSKIFYVISALFPRFSSFLMTKLMNIILKD